MGRQPADQVLEQLELSAAHGIADQVVQGGVQGCLCVRAFRQGLLGDDRGGWLGHK